jgi:hypothetical protein
MVRACGRRARNDRDRSWGSVIGPGRAAEDGSGFAADPAGVDVELITDDARGLEITTALRGSRQLELLVLQAQHLTRTGNTFAIAA